MAPKKVVKIMNQKGQKGNKVTLFVDEKLNKKGKAVPQGRGRLREFRDQKQNEDRADGGDRGCAFLQRHKK